MGAVAQLSRNTSISSVMSANHTLMSTALGAIFIALMRVVSQFDSSFERELAKAKHAAAEQRPTTAQRFNVGDVISHCTSPEGTAE